MIDPIAFSVGNFDVRWYALMYLIGFFVIFFLLRWRISQGESVKDLTPGSLWDLMVLVFLGAIIGGRMGYVLFYDPGYFIGNPAAIIFPVNSSGEFTGISGMSFHGGLIGALAFGYFYSWWRKLSFFQLADFVIPAVPAGYFFGRVGNFLNNELWGRATDVPWAVMVDNVKRHPSQIYEALLEGVLLFIILWTLRNKKFTAGSLLAFFIGLYSVLRFIVEFFRGPDPQLGFVLFDWITLGQIFSISFFIFAIILFISVQNFDKMSKPSHPQETGNGRKAPRRNA